MKTQKLSISSDTARRPSLNVPPIPKLSFKSRKYSAVLRTPKLSMKSPRVSIDYSTTSSTFRPRTNLQKFLYFLPCYRYISKLLLLDASLYGSEYLDESQELALLKKSEADLFYPIHMARMPVVKSAQSTYFHDGKKKIDFVLLFEEIDLLQQSGQRKKSGKSQETQSTLSFDHLQIADRMYKSGIAFKRESYLAYLQNAGIYMEEDIIKTQYSVLHFVKLSASYSLLTRFAEELQLRVPLEIQPEITTNWSSIFFHRLGVKNIFMQYVPEEPLNFYTATFKTAKLKNYLWSDQTESFFTNIQRMQIMNEILQMCHYGQMGKTEVGIERLLEEGAFSAAYPLHDGNWEISNRDTNNMRYILYNYWARPGKWFKYQPINHIRAYYGEKIAFYFAFLGFYVSWLTIYAVFGLIIFAIQIYQSLGDKIINELCESGQYFAMCPRCEECQKWYLSDFCYYYKSAAVFDSIPMVIFSLFSCIWANVFLANWKRNSYLLAYQWSSHEVVWEEQKPRPNYMVRAPLLRLNPVTGRTEPYFPRKEQKSRIVVSRGCLVVMTVIMLISIELSILYRSTLIYYGNSFSDLKTRRLIATASSIGASILQLLLILTMGHFYSKAAVALTEWEMHRTETEFENNLIFKLFLFQFINYFTPLFYSAFLKTKFVKDPNKQNRSFLGFRMLADDYCAGYSCFLELSVQLFTFLAVKQSIWLLVHKLKELLQKPKFRIEDDSNQQWETDSKLDEPEGFIKHYLDIVLQFSFITLFAAAFPLAPFLALVRNVIEIRRSSSKLVCHCRRPVPQQAKSIEVWYDILRTIAILSAVSNGFIIAFTSDLIPKIFLYSKTKGNTELYVNYTTATVYNESLGECRVTFPLQDISTFRYLFLIVYEHIALAITLFIQVFVPTIPQSLQLRLKREQFIAKQTNTETALATLDMTRDTAPTKSHRKKRVWTAWSEAREGKEEPARKPNDMKRSRRLSMMPKW